jgi:UDP-3-O-[3-hydroxymyristoyl] glucosamine N-acyltransferase
MRLSAIAIHLKGTLRGEDKEILKVSTIEDASGSEITFLANPKYTEKAYHCKAGAIIVKEEFAVDIPQVIVDNPYLAFAEVITLLNPEKEYAPGISNLAYIHEEAHIHKDATIFPHVFVGKGARIGEKTVVYPGCFIGDDVEIDSDTLLYPHVVIYDGCRIGKHCIIHAGVVIGADGFGFVWDGSRHRKIPQVGIVIIADEVEIGSNCTIDRAALTATMIGSDVKMDNLVHIGHNVTVGDHTIIVAQTGIAGSASIGRHVVLAGQCGVAGHIMVGDGCTAASRAGITSDLPPGKVVSGYPAFDHQQWLRVQKVYKELPDLAKRIRALERRLDGKD